MGVRFTSCAGESKGFGLLRTPQQFKRMAKRGARIPGIGRHHLFHPAIDLFETIIIQTVDQAFKHVPSKNRFQIMGEQRK